MQNSRHRLALHALVFSLATISTATADTILYVDQNATGNADGSSWLNAYTDLRVALDVAGSTPGHEEIRVAAGLYRPPAVPGVLPGNAIGYSLPGDVTLRGGFPGVAPMPDENGELRTIFSMNEFMAANIMIEFANANVPSEVFNIDFGGYTSNGEFIDDFSGTIGFRVDNAELIIRDCRFLGHVGYSAPGGLGATPISASNAAVTVEQCDFSRVRQPPLVYATQSSVNIRGLDLSDGAPTNESGQSEWTGTLVLATDCDLLLDQVIINDYLPPPTSQRLFDINGSNVEIKDSHLSNSRTVFGQVFRLSISNSTISGVERIASTSPIEAMTIADSHLSDISILNLSTFNSGSVRLINSWFSNVSNSTLPNLGTGSEVINCQFVDSNFSLQPDYYANVIIRNCDFIDSHRTPIQFQYSISDSFPILIEDCNFDNNQFGAIYTRTPLMIKNCTFTNNRPTPGVSQVAASVDIYTGTNPVATVIDGCRFDSNVAWAGALWIDGYAVLNNCDFIDNTGTASGSIDAFVRPGPSNIEKGLRINECQFIGNTGGEAGAVLLDAFEDVSITNCVFQDNWALPVIPNQMEAIARGGAVFITNDPNTSANQALANIDVRDCRFVDNVATFANGGAINAKSLSVSISDCQLERNIADEGGAIYSDNNGPSTFRSCDLIENTALIDGGGIESVSNGPYKINQISDCRLIGNEAGNAGGGLVTDHRSETMIDNSLFVGNRGGIVGGIWSGGAPSVVGSSQSTYHITNSVIAANLCVNGIGGIGAEFTDIEITNSTIAFNQSENQTARAAGVDTLYSITTLQNSVLYNNTVPNASGFSSEFIASAPMSDDYPVTLLHNNIRGLPTELQTNGNISTDPLFANPTGPDGLLGTADDDYSLQIGSPCHDAGDNGLILALLATAGINAAEARDIRGGYRFDNDPTVAPDSTDDAAMFPVDMGAYEFNDCDGNGIDDNIDIAAVTLTDCDGDGIPDACDDQSDTDGDGVVNDCDNCPTLTQANQDDTDLDGVGDACDTCPGFDDSLDIDGDGVPDGCDTCLFYRAGDLTRDGVVNIGDLSIFVDVLLDGEYQPTICGADADVNGVIDSRDVAPFIESLTTRS